MYDGPDLDEQIQEHTLDLDAEKLIYLAFWLCWVGFCLVG